MTNKEDLLYLSVIDSWMNDSDTCCTSYLSNSGEHIFAYYYYDQAAFDGNINIVTGDSWKDVLEKAFIDPIVDYLDSNIDDQIYFSNDELNLLKPYLNSYLKDPEIINTETRNYINDVISSKER